MASLSLTWGAAVARASNELNMTWDNMSWDGDEEPVETPHRVYKDGASRRRRGPRTVIEEMKLCMPP